MLYAEITNVTDEYIEERKNVFRVLIMNVDDGVALVENVFHVNSISEISLFEEFDNVHHVSHGNKILETGALSLAEALEATL